VSTLYYKTLQNEYLLVPVFGSVTAPSIKHVVQRLIKVLFTIHLLKFSGQAEQLKQNQNPISNHWQDSLENAPKN